jgi:WD40 repeat protein
MGSGWCGSNFVAGGAIIRSSFGHHGNTARLFDVENGQDLFKETDGVHAVTVSKNNQRFVVRYDGNRSSEVWDVRLQRPILTLKQPSNTDSTTATISQDGRHVFVGIGLLGKDNFIDSIGQLWDVDAGRILFEVHENFEYHDRVQFLSNDRIMFNGDKVLIKDLTGTTIASFPESLPTVSTSGDGKTIAIVDGLSTRLIDAQSLKQLHRLDGIVASPYSHFSPDNRYILLCHKDPQQPPLFEPTTMSIYDLQSGARLHTIHGPANYYYVHWGSNAVALGTTLETSIWDLANSSIQAFSGLGSVAPDRSRLVTFQNSATPEVREFSTGRVVARLRGHTDVIKSAAWSPDSQRILTASADKTARIWQRRRPDTPFGWLYLPELWLTAILAIAFIWSLLIDRKS